MICDTGLGITGIKQSTPMVSRWGKSTIYSCFGLADRSKKLHEIRFEEDSIEEEDSFHLNFEDEIMCGSDNAKNLNYSGLNNLNTRFKKGIASAL